MMVGLMLSRCGLLNAGEMRLVTAVGVFGRARMVGSEATMTRKESGGSDEEKVERGERER